jgi:hypothetical protein
MKAAKAKDYLIMVRKSISVHLVKSSHNALGRGKECIQK